MAKTDGLCDVCHRRPATTTMKAVSDGSERIIQVCDVDYRRLRSKRAYQSPFESLFAHDDPFSDFFSDFGNFGDFSSRIGYPIPRHREAIDIDQYLSEHTKELIQQAAQTALEFGRDEVDTEHLLYAISDSDVVQEIFKQLSIGAPGDESQSEESLPG